MQIKINNKWLNSQVLKNPDTHRVAPGAVYIGVRMQHPTEAAQVLKDKAHHQTDDQDVPVVICYGLDIHDGVILKFKPYERKVETE